MPYQAGDRIPCPSIQLLSGCLDVQHEAESGIFLAVRDGPVRSLATVHRCNGELQPVPSTVAWKSSPSNYCWWTSSLCLNRRISRGLCASNSHCFVDWSLGGLWKESIQLLIQVLHGCEMRRGNHDRRACR